MKGALSRGKWLCLSQAHTLFRHYKKHPSDGSTFLEIFQLKKKGGADKMAQWVETLATKPDDLRSIPRTPVVKERTDSQELSPYFNKLTRAPSPACGK